MQNKYSKLTMELEQAFERNKCVPFEEGCNLPGAIVHLNLTEDQVRHIKSGKRNFVVQQYEDAVTKEVEEWLRQGTNQLIIGKTPIILSLLAVKQLGPDGEVRKIRVCLDLRPLDEVLTMDNAALPTVGE